LITFGESGWFGVISEEIGFETIGIVAQAVADCLSERTDSATVVLGYDTRFLSREYAWCVQKVLTANRIRLFMHKKPVPTPFLSMSVRLYQADLGIMITGEDRPARYSGMTFRLPSGCPVTRDWMDSLFHHLYRRYPRSSEDSRHLLRYIDVFPEYAARLQESVDIELIRSNKPNIASDSFFGSVGTYMQEMTRKLGLSGIHIRTRPNPGFMDSVPQPNDRNMNPLSKLVMNKKGDMGIFFNGDGSIMGAVSALGRRLPHSWVCAAMLEEWLTANGRDFDIYTEIFTPAVIHSLISRHGLEALPLCRLNEENRPLERAVICDRHCLILGSFLPDRDAVFQGMLLLQALCRHKLNWKQFMEHMEALAGDRHFEQKVVHLDAQVWENKQGDIPEKAEKLSPEKMVEVTEAGDDRKLVFEDGSWLGFSYNGKESSLFIYCDAVSRQWSDKFLSELIAWFME